MDRLGLRLSGKRPLPLRSRRPKVLARTLIGLSAMLLLTNCVTTQTTVTTTEAQCAAWRRITYSAKGDTQPTVTQVRRHNKVGRSLGCWK